MDRQSKNIVPTISRVENDTLIELVYDPAARATALVVGRASKIDIVREWKTASGEVLVPYAASNNLIRHGCVMLPSEPLPSGGQSALVRDIEAYLHRYVDLSPLFERIAAHYILLTWVFDAFTELPYLRLRGDFGSGKTRALIALGSVSYKGFFASGASTVSPIFHILDTFGGTLVLDEADLRFSDMTTDLVKILNNGTVKGLPVLRTLQNRNREFNPAAFRVFGPKIVAMRGSFRDPALESRFLTEPMGVRPLRPDIPIQLPQSLASEALVLRNRLLDFRLSNLRSIRSNPDRLVAGLDPRLNQTALSLLSLMEDAKLREEFAAYLRERNRELELVRANNIDQRIMRALASAFADTTQHTLPIAEIAVRANRDGSQTAAISAREVGRVLRARSIRLHKSRGEIVASRP